MYRISPPKFARYQLLVLIAGLIPLAWLVFSALTNNLTANPIQAVEQRTGRYALYLLIASLACTPIYIVSGWSVPLRWRRPLGLYAFMYALIHFLTFLGLDYGFDLGLIWTDVAKKRYIIVGASAFVILLMLALTSTKAGSATKEDVDPAAPLGLCGRRVGHRALHLVSEGRHPAAAGLGRGDRPAAGAPPAAGQAVVRNAQGTTKGHTISGRKILMPAVRGVDTYVIDASSSESPYSSQATSSSRKAGAQLTMSTRSSGPSHHSLWR